MDKVAEKIRRDYSQTNGAEYADWKQNDALPPHEALDIWKNVRLSFFGNRKSDLVFVSPTANFPTHEIEIFRDEAHYRNGKTTFLVGDIADINPKGELSQIKNIQGKKDKFIFFSWDARSLPIDKETVDAIWDRRGWIWHSANLDENREEVTLKSLENYASLLKKGGVIIVDADSGQDSGQKGPSTDTVMRTRIGEDFLDSERLKKVFDHYYLGQDSQRVLILVKK